MRKSLLVVAASMLMATACPVEPEPQPDPWVTTRVPIETGPPPVAHLSAWTDANWFVTATGNVPFSASSLRFHPRSGPGNSVLGAPQVVPTSLVGGLQLIGQHLLGARGNVAGTGAVEFFEETAGTWGSAGVVEFPGENPLALTDDWLVTRPAVQQLGQDSVLNVYAIDDSGPTVTATLADTLEPDPAWNEDLRSFFGTSISIDGGIIVASAVQGAADGDGLFPGAARVFRLAAGSWDPAGSLGGAVGGPLTFGASTAVDDGASTDRVVISHKSAATSGGGPVDPKVEIYADGGAGFAPEQTLTPDPSLPPDVSSVGAFGSSVALDGDLLALTSRWATAPSADTAAPDATVGYVQLFRRGASTWTRESEKGTFTSPVPAPLTASTPSSLQMAGNHVAATVLVGFPIPPGCTFPQICLNFSVEAWSIDKTS